MAGDPEIRVSVTAVTGEAANALKQFSDQAISSQEKIKVAQKALKDATKEYQQALKELVPTGQAVNDVNAASKAILDGYRTAVDQAAQAVQRLKEAQAQESLLARQAIIQQKRDYEEWIQKNKELADAAEHVVPQMAATSGVLRELKLDFDHNIRSAERFLATTLGLGPALQAAFPVVGALAFAGVLVDMGEKLGKFASDAALLGRQLGVGWLDGAVAEVTGLAKEIKQADDELLKLAQDRDRLRTKQESSDVEHARLEAEYEAFQRGLKGAQAAAEGQKAADKVRSDQLQHQIDALEAIKRLNKANADALGDQVKTAQQQAAQQRQIRGELEQTNTIGQSVEIAKLQKDQQVAIAQYNGALKEQQQLIREKNDLELKSAVAQQREDRSGAKAPKENYADELAAQQLAHGKSLGETVLYWEAVVEKTGKYHEQLLRAEEAFNKNLAEKGKFRAALEKSERKADEIKAPSGDLEVLASNFTDYFNKTGQAWEAYNAQVARGREIQDQARARIEETTISVQEHTGAISRVSADQALASVHAKEYADKLYDLRQQLKALNDELPEAAKSGKLPEVQARIQGVQNQIDATKGQAAVTGIQDSAKTAQDLAAPYVKAAETINSAWLGMQDKLIFGTRHVAQAFANMGVSILQSVARSFEQMLVKQLQYEIQSRIAHQVSNQVKIASDAQAAAQGEALHRTSALKEEFINAKVAATGAFKGVMAHVPPPLNVILAPLAAAGAFAGTLAVGAFEKGGIITGPTMALMGEAGSEAVLPHRLTNMLMSAANHYGGDTTNSNTSVHSTFNAHGITDRNFRDMARRHSDVIFDAAHSAVRTGKRRVG